MSKKVRIWTQIHWPRKNSKPSRLPPPVLLAVLLAAVLLAVLAAVLLAVLLAVQRARKGLVGCRGSSVHTMMVGMLR